MPSGVLAAVTVAILTRKKQMPQLCGKRICGKYNCHNNHCHTFVANSIFKTHLPQFRVAVFISQVSSAVLRGYGNQRQECYWAPVASHTCTADALGICKS